MASNHEAAVTIRQCVGGDIILFNDRAFEMAFSEYEAIIAVMACGIAVRQLAPLIRDKWTDPPVVVVDTGLHNAISLCGGHHGANELAQQLAGIGAQPVITTATEVLQRPNVENMAKTLECEIMNRDSTRVINSYLLKSDLPVISIQGPKVVMVDPDVAVLKKTKDHPKTGVIVGIGTRRGVLSGNVVIAVKQALSECGLGLKDVELFASAQIKEHESGLIEAINEMGGQIVFIPAEVINSINPPSDSEARKLGLNGVSEPCALALSRDNRLIMKKKVYDNVTIAIAR